MKAENQTILTPLVSLPTPGKATVTVVIVADPVSSHLLTGKMCKQFSKLSKGFICSLALWFVDISTANTICIPPFRHNLIQKAL